MIQEKYIVIIGAGFAGLKLARMLNNHEAYHIILIDKNNYHQFQPLFYQVAMANLDASNISFPLRSIFKNSKNVSIRVETVVNINADDSKVETNCNTYNYDYLVIATGATTNFFGNESIASHSFPMKSTWDALQIRNALFKLLEDAVSSKVINNKKSLSVVIVGGGATGVELSGALAEMKRFSLPSEYPDLDFLQMKIYLIEGTGKLLGNMSHASSKSAKKYLEDLGVIVITNTFVNEYNGDVLQLSDGKRINSTLVIWAAGVQGYMPKGLSFAQITKTNQLKTNLFHKVIGKENVFALGDISFIETKANPKGFPQMAGVAIDRAKNLANNFIRMAKDEEILPYKYINKGSMATVGRNKAVVDLAKPAISFHGFFAWFIWMSLHLFLLIGFKNKIVVFINWVYKYVTHHQSLSIFFEPIVRLKKAAHRKEAKH